MTHPCILHPWPSPFASYISGMRIKHCLHIIITMWLPMNCVMCTHMITVPDDLVLSVVTRRLSNADCTALGWVLHGFPLTGNQAELLTQAGYKPNRYACMCIIHMYLHRLYPKSCLYLMHRSEQHFCFFSPYVPYTRSTCMYQLFKFYRVFFLELPEETIKERLTLRRLDPISGERYEHDNSIWTPSLLVFSLYNKVALSINMLDSAHAL